MNRSRTRVRYIWIPVLIALAAIPAGWAYVAWTKGGEGAGVYSREWRPDPMQAYWDPARFYESPQSVEGVFTSEQCIECHAGLTPGIVADWRASRHAAPASGEPVRCPACHGDDHQRLRLPTPEVCGGCHAQQHAQFLDERRYGFPSHVLAMERAYDAPHYADKPKAEVLSCVQCHSVATKCDSCHTRHRFDPGEARRPEACITCHSGPPHPDDETFFESAHGKLYLAQGDRWDWSKPLTKGNYPGPTCAYCHMDGGRHQVANKSIWKFGLREVNPQTSQNQVLRERWIDRCSDCHGREESAAWLTEMDRERKRAWDKLYAAESVLREARAEDRLLPAPGHRPGYPMSRWDRIWPRARIGFFEGQASAFYNVSALERDYFEMWYFDSLGAYKAAAHGTRERVDRQHARMDRALHGIKVRAGRLTRGDSAPAGASDSDPWRDGEYTRYNAEHN